MSINLDHSGPSISLGSSGSSLTVGGVSVPTSLKTINGNSIVGTGNLVVGGSSTIVPVLQSQSFGAL